MKKAIIILSCLILNILSAQTSNIKVALNERTVLDNGFYFLAVFHDKPKEKLILPNIDLSKAHYFSIFYSWDIEDDESVSVIILSKDSVDILYIDRNNDENLLNDGNPFYFPHNKNTFVFEIFYPLDKNQRTLISLARRSKEIGFVDSTGNLNPRTIQMRKIQNPGFEGKKGTFYLDDRLNVSRGIININNKEIQIGICDWNNNGVFNDSDDFCIIDFNEDKKLSSDIDNEVFRLNDVIKISDNNYQITEFSKYGKYLILQETEKPITHYYIQSVFLSSTPDLLQLDESFWDLKIKDLKGNSIDIGKLKGKNILLNFWGEWCSPCISEIPDLVEFYNNPETENFEIISFLSTNNRKRAEKIIADKNMRWFHVELTDALEKEFKILSYPTNFIISTDGKLVKSLPHIYFQKLKETVKEF